MKLIHRKILATTILAAAVALAVYIALPDEPGTGAIPDTWLFRLMEVLQKIEFLHIMAHLATFGSVGLLLGEWGTPGQRGDAKLAWRYVIWGAIIMEALQAPIGWKDGSSIGGWILTTGFDFAVDFAAAWLGLKLARRYDAVLIKLQARQSAEPLGAD